MTSIVVAGRVPAPPAALSSIAVVTTAAVVAVAIVVLVVRAVAARRLRAGLVGYAVVPSKRFDPTSEEIRRYASGLRETRRVTSASLLLPRRRMMRFAFVSDPNGHLVTVVSAPKSARSLLTHAYDQTNTVPAADVVDAVSWLPPPTPEPDPDPLPVRPPAEPESSNPPPSASVFLGGL